MHNTENGAEICKETFAHFGLVMYQAQCIEKSLAILVSSVFNGEFLPSSEERREALSRHALSLTIGKLIARLKKQIPVPVDLEEKLEKARAKRNWLAHEYFWERAGELMTVRGRKKMISELREQSAEFEKIDGVLTSMYIRWGGVVGLKQSDIDEAVTKLRRDHD